MPNTTNFALTYPDSSGSTRIWEHFQELAVDIDDVLLAQGLAPWADHSPSFSGLTPGNATIYCRKRKIGKTMFFQGSLTWGTTTSASSTIAVVLPEDAYDANNSNVGHGLIIDASPTDRRITSAQLNGVSQIFFITYNGQIVTNAVPWTFTTNDVIRWQAIYETAT